MKLLEILINQTYFFYRIIFVQIYSGLSDGDNGIPLSNVATYDGIHGDIWGHTPQKYPQHMNF